MHGSYCIPIDSYQKQIANELRAEHSFMKINRVALIIVVIVIIVIILVASSNSNLVP